MWWCYDNKYQVEFEYVTPTWFYGPITNSCLLAMGHAAIINHSCLSKSSLSKWKIVHKVVAPSIINTGMTFLWEYGRSGYIPEVYMHHWVNGGKITCPSITAGSAVLSMQVHRELAYRLCQERKCCEY